MAKKVKFPLDMGNEVYVRTLEELKENYNTEKVTEYFLDGRLLTWLNDRYFDDEAEQVQELTEQGNKDNLAAKLGKIFGVEIESEEVDIEALEIRREKLDKLRRITSDDKILENVDNVAFSQEELGDLLDEEKDFIYLCGETFRIPLSVGNVMYIGVNDPTVSISGKGEIDLEASGIVIVECDFSEDTKARLKVNKAADKIRAINMENFATEEIDGLLCLTEYKGNDKYVEIPDGIEVISASAFEENTDIEVVIIPSSVVTIDEGAFSDCENLKSVEIPNNVITIEDYTFMNCVNLESVEIPNSIVTIGDSAFMNCENLKNIEIPNSVQTIGDSAFNGCTNLETVNIPAGVETIGSSAFAYCASLTEINVDPNNTKYRIFNGVLFNHDLSVLIQCPAGVNGNYIIPDSVEEIGDSAFCKCSKLESVEIPDSVETIGEHAFDSCGLKSINIPDSVETIEKDAFANCKNLKNVTLSENLTEIADMLFYDCSKLESIEIPYKVSKICWSAFSGCKKLANVTLPNGLREIEDGVFADCISLRNISIPSNTHVEFADMVFADCTNITVKYKGRSYKYDNLNKLDEAMS